MISEALRSNSTLTTLCLTGDEKKKKKKKSKNKINKERVNRKQYWRGR